MKKRILILGSSGLLGSSLTPKIKLLDYEIVTHSLNKKSDYKVDLSVKNNVFDLLKNTQPDIIINLVALTDVDYCEKNPDEAYVINVQVVTNITDYIIQSSKHIHLLQISTDQIYDNGNHLHNEDDVSIKNIYAFSKIMSEAVVGKVSSSILRTNFFGKSYSINKISLTDWVYHNLKKGKTLKAFNNVYFNPLSLETLCSIIADFIDKNHIGIYNVGSCGCLSKANFIIHFAKMLSLPTDNIIEMPVEKVLLEGAYRPRNMLMNCEKLENKLSCKMPNLVDEIKLCVKDYL